MDGVIISLVYPLAQSDSGNNTKVSVPRAPLCFQQNVVGFLKISAPKFNDRPKMS